MSGRGPGVLKRLVVATTNQGKWREFSTALTGVATSIELLAPDFIMPEETGSTFMENALLKARFVAERLAIPTLADDSGLVVAALGGAPGVYSARYAGMDASDDDNRKSLLAAMTDIPEGVRQAHFVAALALVWPDGRELTALGECNGQITTAPCGEGGFGYDSLFFYPPLHKTFAQMDVAEKGQLSHRAVALRLLKERLQCRGGTLDA